MPPHPTEPAALLVQPSPARGEGADMGAEFFDAVGLRAVPE